MEIFAFLIAGAIIAFFVLVIWSAVRVAKLGGTELKVEQLGRELERLDHRIVLLEKRSSESPAKVEPSERPQSTPAAVPNEAPMRPARPATVKMPLPSTPLMKPVFAEPVPTAPPRSAPSLRPAKPLATGA